MKTRSWLLSSLAIPCAFFLAACSAQVSERAPSSPPQEQGDEGALGEPPVSEDGLTETPSSSNPPPAATGPACEALSPRTSPLELFIQPEVGTTPFTDAINHAKKTVDVMVYQMGYGPILEGLEAQARAGVKVRVILDVAQKDVNEKYMNRLLAAGATVVWSSADFVFMHAKVIISDGAEAIISTGNYSESYMLKERNFAIRDTDPADLEVLEKIFNADFALQTPDVSCTRLLVAPVNARERLLAFIKSAKSTITVHSMQFGDKEVRDAIAERKDAGVDVRVILADPNWIDANVSAGTFLAQHAIPVKWNKHVHVKSIIVDNKAAYVGSINLSWNSITKNREVGLLVTEQSNVTAATTTFDKDWATGTAF